MKTPCNIEMRLVPFFEDGVTVVRFQFGFRGHLREQGSIKTHPGIHPDAVRCLKASYSTFSSAESCLQTLDAHVVAVAQRMLPPPEHQPRRPAAILVLSQLLLCMRMVLLKSHSKQVVRDLSLTLLRRLLTFTTVVTPSNSYMSPLVRPLTLCDLVQLSYPSSRRCQRCRRNFIEVSTTT
jgi:hypothetical protein